AAVTATAGRRVVTASSRAARAASKPHPQPSITTPAPGLAYRKRGRRGLSRKWQAMRLCRKRLNPLRPLFRMAHTLPVIGWAGSKAGCHRSTFGGIRDG
ncbi:ATP-dependent RNA helicase DeaD, partial [Stenotrophomonas maltophilia]